MKWWRLLLLGVVAALSVWAWALLHPSPERQIRRQLEKLAKTASFAPNQGFLSKAVGAERLADLCATNIEVKIEVPGRPEHTLSGREDIHQTALAVRASVASLNVTFPDIAITVSADRQSAEVDLTLEAHVGGDQDMIVQEAKVRMQKIEGQWLISKVETVRTLK